MREAFLTWRIHNSSFAIYPRTGGRTDGRVDALNNREVSSAGEETRGKKRENTKEAKKKEKRKREREKRKEIEEELRGSNPFNIARLRLSARPAAELMADFSLGVKRSAVG